MTPATPYQKHRFHVLDGMRGIAAVLVMFFHFYSRNAYPFLKNTFVAVDFFFILSGFVIYHAYGTRILAQMKWSEYFASRFARLFPMVAVGLMLGFYPLLVMTREGHANYSDLDLILSMLLNLLMLPYLNDRSKDFGNHSGVTGQIFPADDPLWSIFAELFASLIFLWLIRMTSRRLALFCAWSLAVFWAFSFINALPGGGLLFDPDMGWNTRSFVGIFPRVCFGFGCGVLLYRVKLAPNGMKIFQRLSQMRRLHPLIIYILLLAFLVFPLRLGGIYALIAVSIFAPLLVAAGSTSLLPLDGGISKASEFLGWISYPIYCLHRPVFNVLAEWDARSGLLAHQHISLPVVAVVATLVLSVTLAWLFDYAHIQQKLTRLLAGSRPHKLP